MVKSLLPQFRIVVNSRCGRACYYCRPSGESVPISGFSESHLADVLNLGSVALDLGLASLETNRGDPALWPPLVECVASLKRLGMCDVEVISRHPRLETLSRGLADAGLTLLTVSIDTTDPVRHRTITGRDDLLGIVRGLRACIRAGLTCKVNAVVRTNTTAADLEALIQFCEGEGVRILKLLDLITDLDHGREAFSSRLVHLGGGPLIRYFSPLGDVENTLRRRAIKTGVTTQGGLGHPMGVFELPSGLVVVVKNSARGRWFGDICKGCRHFPCHDALMALRVTPDLRLQFCLLGEDRTVSIRDKINSKELLSAALKNALAVYANSYMTENAPQALLSCVS